MVSKLITSTKFVFIFPAVLLAFNFFVAYAWKPVFAQWLSAPFHFLGGAAMTMLFFYFWEKNQHLYSFKKMILISLILVLGFVALTGVLWELFEFFLDVIFPQARPSQPSLDDTMADLFWDLIGCLAIAALYFKSGLYKTPENMIKK